METEAREEKVIFEGHLARDPKSRKKGGVGGRGADKAVFLQRKKKMPYSPIKANNQKG